MNRDTEYKVNQWKEGPFGTFQSWKVQKENEINSVSQSKISHFVRNDRYTEWQIGYLVTCTTSTRFPRESKTGDPLSPGKNEISVTIMPESVSVFHTLLYPSTSLPFDRIFPVSMRGFWERKRFTETSSHGSRFILFSFISWSIVWAFVIRKYFHVERTTLSLASSRRMIDNGLFWFSRVYAFLSSLITWALVMIISCSIIIHAHTLSQLPSTKTHMLTRFLPHISRHHTKENERKKRESMREKNFISLIVELFEKSKVEK